MHKSITTYLFFLTLTLLISCSETKRNDVGFIFKGTKYQIENKQSIATQIRDLSSYKNLSDSNFIKLNNDQIQAWINSFQNIGGHEFQIISLDRNKYYHSLYILAKGDGFDNIHLINVSDQGHFIDALTILNNHRSGPKEDSTNGHIVHFEITNSIISNDTIQRTRTQVVSDCWESSLMFENLIIENFKILNDGRIKQIDK